MSGPHFPSSTWYPLYVWEHEDLWVVRETGPNIVDDVALFELVRGGTAQGDPRLGEGVLTMNIVLDNLRDPGWNKAPRLGSTIHGTQGLYSSEWLAFIHDLILPQEIRVERTSFWQNFDVPHFIDDRVLQRMRTDVVEHKASYDRASEKFADVKARVHLSGQDIAGSPERAKLDKVKKHLIEMMDNIVSLPFAAPLGPRHRFRVDINNKHIYIVRINPWLKAQVRYRPSIDRWIISRLGRYEANLASGDTLAETWESAMETLTNQGEEVLQDSEYEAWVDGLEHGEELVDISMFEALNAGNPILWSEPQFIQWMDTLGGIKGVLGG